MVNKINNNKDLVALSGLVGFVIISGLFLSSSLVSADDSTVATATVTVPASCTMSGTGMNSHTAEIPNGTYQNNIGTTTLHAFCNDANGFAIYAAGYTGNEIGATNSNKLVGTSASGNAVIDTGLATSAGNPDVSNWAMKLAIQSDSGNTTGTNAVTIDSDTEGSFASYHTVPNEYKKVAHKNTATDMTASTGGVKLTTTYAAYISKTQPADTYTGQVIYTLVHPSDHAAPNGCNPDATTISEMRCMQDFASLSSANKTSVLNSMTPEQQYTLKDSRDNKTYTIAKYIIDADWTEYGLAADYIDSCEGGECDSSLYNQLSSDWQNFVDSCNGSFDNWDDSIAEALVAYTYSVWMTKNLDLDLDSSVTYTNLDTDLGWNGTSYSTASWSPDLSTYPTGTSTWTDSKITPESYDPGDLYWSGTGNDSTPVTTGIPQYHLGNYYNWTAALAMNASNDVVGGRVDQSICPAGWTLPYANRNNNQPEGDFADLWTVYEWISNGNADGYFSDATLLIGDPLYFVLSGWYRGSLEDVGNSGQLWSSTARNALDITFASFDNYGSANAASVTGRYYGNSVRCILR